MGRDGYLWVLARKGTRKKKIVWNWEGVGVEGNWDKLRLKNEFIFSSSIKYISLLYSIYLGTQYFKKIILYLSLSIFWKYIYLTAYISKHLFLHFSYTISYTLTTPLHITHHNSSKLHSHALSLWNSTVLLPINISQYSSPRRHQNFISKPFS